MATIGFAAGGSYTVLRGFDARGEVRAELLAESIVTPEDARIPNERVDDHITAHAQASVIRTHALERTDSPIRRNHRRLGGMVLFCLPR